MLGARAGHHYLLQIEHILLQFKVERCSFSLGQGHLNLLRFVTHKLCHDGLSAHGKIGHFEVSRFIGCASLRGSFHKNSSIGNVLLCCLVLHIAKEHGVGFIGLSVCMDHKEGNQ